MIGELNKDNPYVIQLLESYESLELKSIRITREYVHTVIVIILTALISLFIFLYPLRFAGIICPAILLVTVSTIIFLYKILQDVLNTSPLKEIRRIVYGNQYERIYVNNEKLLKLIQEVTRYEGKTHVLSKVLNMCRKILFLSIPCMLFIRIMILFVI